MDDSALDLYVIVGADPAARLSAYTALTGRPDVPPPWAFGYWMGRCRYHSADEMLQVGQTMREHEVPLDVLHLDPDWLVVDRLNTDFIWNTGVSETASSSSPTSPTRASGCRCGSCPT